MRCAVISAHTSAAKSRRSSQHPSTLALTISSASRNSCSNRPRAWAVEATDQAHRRRPPRPRARSPGRCGRARPWPRRSAGQARGDLDRRRSSTRPADRGAAGRRSPPRSPPRPATAGGWRARAPAGLESRRPRRHQVDLVPDLDHRAASLRRRRPSARPAPCGRRAAWASVSSLAMSRTCRTTSASCTSSRVARKASTSSCGRSEMKPTVSDRIAGRPSGSFSDAQGRVQGGEQHVLGHDLGRWSAG